MDWPTVAATLGSAWLSGINLYATVGLLQPFGLARLPGDVGYLSEAGSSAWRHYYLEKSGA
jgi:hypothetical protein